MADLLTRAQHAHELRREREHQLWVTKHTARMNQLGSILHARLRDVLDVPTDEAERAVDDGEYVEARDGLPEALVVDVDGVPLALVRVADVPPAHELVLARMATTPSGVSFFITTAPVNELADVIDRLDELDNRHESELEAIERQEQEADA